MVDRSQANMKVLSDTEVLQAKTKAALERTQLQLLETEEVGASTIEELHRNDEQLDDVDRSLENVSSKQAETEKLQKQFNFWSMTSGGKGTAGEEAALLREREEIRNTREVWEYETFDTMKQHWKKYHIISTMNPSLICDDGVYLHSGSEATGTWKVDFSSSDIDIDGWTYGFDIASLNKNGKGDSKAKWNSYVRRRKWHFADGASGVRTVFNGVVSRIEARKEQVANAANTVINAAKDGVNSATNSVKGSGYVPRPKHSSTMQASGLSSAGMLHHREEEVLDAASATRLQQVEETNRQIDSGIDVIDKQMDRVGAMASTMRDETREQNAKIDKIDQKLQKVGDKQAINNAKLKYSVNKN